MALWCCIGIGLGSPGIGPSALPAAAAHDARSPPPRAFFVANSGNDSAVGDAAHPWRTLARVAQQAMGGGDTIFLAAGDTWDEPLVVKGPAASCTGSGMRGDFERVVVNASSGAVSVLGWVVDPLLRGSGVPPVAVRVLIDGVAAATAVADVFRPDLVKAGVAPNPQHGFAVLLDAAATTLLQHGTHRLAVAATSAAPGCGPFSWRPPGPILSAGCVCDGKLCACPAGSTEPVTVRGTGASTAKRPTIRLGGAGTGITFAGLASVAVAGVEVVDASVGVDAEGSAPVAGGGTAAVTDCVFRGVWNRSSIGQARPGHTGRDCTSGWSTTVSLGGFATAVVAGNVFDDVDVAFMPRGAGVPSVWIASNTMTRANGNTVMMVGQAEYRIDSNGVFCSLCGG